VSLWAGLRESVLGLVVGGGVVYGIVEFGKKLFGRRNLKVKADSVVRLTDRCVMVDERSIPLASLFANGTESIAFRARRVAFYDIQYENVACSLTPTALSIGDDMGELKDLGDVVVVLDEPISITVPSVAAEASEGAVTEGNEVLTLEPGTELTICDRRLLAEDVKDGAEDFPFVELFYRRGDRVRFHADSMQCAGRTFEKVDVRLSETALEVGEESIPLATALPVEATTSQVVIPREAMGFGDVKLMAAIGAFLGWKATIFTLMVSSVLGSAVGLTLIACRMRAWQSKIPYGPYIAAGALIWMFGGKGWVETYMELFRY
jgi:prepilin signal peptidase PulO-like enzyme (type II secretory pathway)